MADSRVSGTINSMDIPDEALDEFIEIYKREFNEDISRSEARRRATNLLALYRAIGRN